MYSVGNILVRLFTISAESDACVAADYYSPFHCVYTKCSHVSVLECICLIAGR